jgi:hypothetical protein
MEMQDVELLKIKEKRDDLKKKREEFNQKAIKRKQMEHDIKRKYLESLKAPAAPRPHKPKQQDDSDVLNNRYAGSTFST